MSDSTPKAADLDLQAAHRLFAAQCFNRAWDLIEKPDRTPEEDRQMIALSQASYFHWTQRDDVDDRRRSIGCWQLARVHALIGAAGEARRYAQACLGYSGALPPFYLGYAYEALAFAALVSGDRAGAAAHAAQSATFADRVEDPEERSLLEADLARFAHLGETN